MRIVTLILGAILLLTVSTGCSDSEDIQKLIEVRSGQAIDIPLTNGNGRLTVTYYENKIIDLMVLAKGLDPYKNYSIHLVRDDQVVLFFGPEENIDIKLGKMDGETIFKPNDMGELFVSMKNPERLMLGAIELKLEIKQEENNVTASSSFIILD